MTLLLHSSSIASAAHGTGSDGGNLDMRLHIMQTNERERDSLFYITILMTSENTTLTVLIMISLRIIRVKWKFIIPIS